MRTTRHERGSALVTVLMVLLALTVAGLATIFLTGTGRELAATQRLQEQALRVAEAGVNSGIDYVADQSSPLVAIQSGYATTGYGGSNADVQLQDGGSPIMVMGSSGTSVPLRAAFRVGRSFDSSGKEMKCGGVGDSDRYVFIRFRVDSRGYGPAGSVREVEAHLTLPPIDMGEGTGCGGATVSGGYAGG